LASVLHACIESILEPLTTKVDILWDPVEEGISGEIVAVELPWQIRIMNVINLGNPCESVIPLYRSIDDIPFFRFRC